MTDTDSEQEKKGKNSEFAFFFFTSYESPWKYSVALGGLVMPCRMPNVESLNVCPWAVIYRS